MLGKTRLLHLRYRCFELLLIGVGALYRYRWVGEWECILHQSKPCLLHLLPTHPPTLRTTKKEEEEERCWRPYPVTSQKCLFTCSTRSGYETYRR